MRRIGIIGTGLAGLRVAAELRGAGFKGRITAWDSRGGEPYDRPALTKKLFRQPRVLLSEQGLGDLGELGVEVVTAEVQEIRPDGNGGWLVVASGDAGGQAVSSGGAGGRAVSFDGAGGRAVSSGGADDAGAGAVDAADGSGEGAGAPDGGADGPGGAERVDIAVVATGSPARASILGAHVVYTLDDARALAAAVEPAARVDIVGGGWIGTELASVCAERGARVQLWEASDRLLGRSLGQAGTEIWMQWLDEAGVTVHLGQAYPGQANSGPAHPAQADSSQADLSQAHLGRAQEAAVLVDATGSEPTFPRMDADLTARRALATDVQTRVLLGGKPRAGLYAVGDCADRVDRPALDGGHWTKALGDGALTAASILGDTPPAFLAPAEVFSTQFGHEIGLVGVVPDSPPRRQDTREGFVLSWHDERGLLALLAVDSPRELARARKALRH